MPGTPAALSDCGPARTSYDRNSVRGLPQTPSTDQSQRARSAVRSHSRSARAGSSRPHLSPLRVLPAQREVTGRSEQRWAGWGAPRGYRTGLWRASARGPGPSARTRSRGGGLACGSTSVNPASEIWREAARGGGGIRGGLLGPLGASCLSRGVQWGLRARAAGSRAGERTALSGLIAPACVRGCGGGAETMVDGRLAARAVHTRPSCATAPGWMVRSAHGRTRRLARRKWRA